MRRTRVGVVVVVIGGSLLLPGGAAAKPPVTKAKAAIAQAIRGQDFTQSSTGDVRVSRCAAKRKHGRVSAVSCRVKVQRVYPDSSYERCVDRSVRANRTQGGYRLVRRSFLNAGGYSCGPRVTTPAPAPPDGPTPQPDPLPEPVDPPVDEPSTELPPPPPDEVPIGLPPGLPPFPFPAANSASARSASVAKLASADPVKARASQPPDRWEFVSWSDYFQVAQYPGVTWIASTWRFYAYTCNWYPAYWEYWWYGYNNVTGRNQWNLYYWVFGDWIYPAGWSYTTERRC